MYPLCIKLVSVLQEYFRIDQDLRRHKLLGTIL